MGPGFSAKDFRTWHASAMSLEMLTRCARAQEAGASGTRQQVLQALRCVAASLGNTLSVCRKAYVHPLVVECFLRGEIALDIVAPGNPCADFVRRSAPCSRCSKRPEDAGFALLAGFLAVTWNRGRAAVT